MPAVELLRSEMSGAKAQGTSRSGISNGISIALVRKVTFAAKSYQKSLRDPACPKRLAFLFCCSAKQKFDCVWV
ncbi:MAG: hypothetical protein IJY43_07130, partial [Clostridia bacterium]|nr:hypothetical protein [Clostridia bacterium]